MNANPMASRSGRSHHLGKCDDDLKINMPTQMKADIQQLAARLGTTAGELGRDLLSDMLYGYLRQIEGADYSIDIRRAVSALSVLRGSAPNAPRTEDEFIGLVLTEKIKGLVHVESMRAAAEKTQG